MEQNAVVLAHHLNRLVAENRFAGAGEKHDLAVFVGREDSIRAGEQDAPEQFRVPEEGSEVRSAGQGLPPGDLPIDIGWQDAFVEDSVVSFG